MAQDTEWFEGRRPDPPQHDYSVILNRVLIVLALIAGSVFVSILAGCSSPPVEQKPHLMVCYMKLLGQTEEGYTVASQYCVTAEEFAASQK